ncbi:hypothetical protein CDD80_6615 [Ophiocordyceps camponoti-rufipedis]|uniref:FCP1 homology domain-containing protein n=1 Tax=Ophiocordyceps camponoti-rufipedis TaxID=2004952 RepID=A0A2C5YJC1_9HYPO|nr:hypothetical protein CDD80_6615 [Ophiocordyceps camponoti-rufipedis]
MNSLNIITSRVSAPSSPTQSRSIEDADKTHQSGSLPAELTAEDDDDDDDDEKPVKDKTQSRSWWLDLPRNIISRLVGSIRLLLTTLVSPGVYVVSCLYDEEGRFAPLSPLGKLFGGRRASLGVYDQPRPAPAWAPASLAPPPPPPSYSSGSSTSGAESESEAEEPKRADAGADSTAKSPSSMTNHQPGRRSIRIKLHAEEKQRKHLRTHSAVERAKASERDISAQLKSPTSPMAALTRYPKTPAPPRPLIPRRQPSYLNLEPVPTQQKTLILDLDETLIHSMSKGGRMSTGHMVEVRLNTASLGMGAAGAAQHPILYWVNKRPFCDEFLRRVCKWFNLVVFTASVQEYADPVIDWLESERKFFSARYYRQHCTYRQGAYIKDLSSVEPDLNNAIPIQGWINDPTDNDLMHLVPMLEGLQYVHDVRALLALRGGEDGQHMA